MNEIGKQGQVKPNKILRKWLLFLGESVTAVPASQEKGVTTLNREDKEVKILTYKLRSRESRFNYEDIGWERLRTDKVKVWQCLKSIFYEKGI